mmetsp:Transcript_10846/g.26061  ORF Transcript_10846/g.26061 Transcript_10846/m.26061 type:complete len:404 (+) Transcript_10846:131-1342(+)
MSHFTNAKMTLFLLLHIAIMLVVGASSSLARFQSLPAFHNKINNMSSGRRIDISAPISSHDLRTMEVLALRCGAQDGDDKNIDENDVKDDDAIDTDGETSDEEGESEDDFSDVSSDDSSDEDDYYDDVTEEEEESELASQLEKKSSISGSSEKTSDTFVEPYFVSPSLQLYTTFGTILLSRKIDMFDPKIVRLTRFLFIVYLLVQQAFIFYIRIMAKRNNDRTPIHVQNPLTSMLSSQLEKQPAGANDMVKNLASSFLKTESTVVEYDMGQARNLQGGILFNVAFMWFLHFKLQQVQPLLVTTVNGFLQLVYSPLFQVYILGRNLERPFKSPEVLKDPRAAQEENPTDTLATEDETTDDGDEDTEIDAVDEDDSESEEDSSDDEVDEIDDDADDNSSEEQDSE